MIKFRLISVKFLINSSGFKNADKWILEMHIYVCKWRSNLSMNSGKNYGSYKNKCMNEKNVTWHVLFNHMINQDHPRCVVLVLIHEDWKIIIGADLGWSHYRKWRRTKGACTNHVDRILGNFDPPLHYADTFTK